MQQCFEGLGTDTAADLTGIEKFYDLRCSGAGLKDPGMLVSNDSLVA